MKDSGVAVQKFPAEVGKRPQALDPKAVSKDDAWLLSWPPKKLPPCAICLGSITIVWGSKIGSEYFMCYPCDAICSVDWIVGGRTRQAEVDWMTKNRPGLSGRIKEKEINMATKTSGKKLESFKVKIPKGGKLLGKTTSKGVAETWINAFGQANTKKWTDEQISRFMKSEFPSRESAIFELKGVKAVRSRYNTGSLLGQNGKPPANRNVSVGSNGKPVPRTRKVKALVRKVVVKG